MSLKSIINQKPFLTADGSYAVYIHTDENDLPLHITFSEADADSIGTPYQVQYIKIDKYKEQQTKQGKCLP